MSERKAIFDAKLEFTPVERVAEAAWAAAHGRRVHTTVGKTARRLAIASRWAPRLITRNRRLAEAGASR